MQIPFTVEQFLSVFEVYNTAIWPFQFVLMLLAFAAVVLSLKQVIFSNKIVVYILSFFWIWMGAVYHLSFFASINKAAIIFGIVFILQGLYFLFTGIIQKQLNFGFRRDIYFLTGAIFILYSLLIYPLIGTHHYPRIPLFGVPCPTTIFTFGLLLWNKKKIPLLLLVVPVLWSFIGFSAAINLRITQDYGLVIAGIVGSSMIIIKNRILPELKVH
jgi:hypothetical protein